jgi:hypothetical protein
MHTNIFSVETFKYGEKVEDGVKRVILDSIRLIEFMCRVTAAFAIFLGVSLLAIFATGFSSPGFPVTESRWHFVLLSAVAMFCIGVLVLESQRKKKQVKASSYSPHVYLGDGKGGVLCSPSGEIVASGLVQRAGEHTVLRADSLFEVEITDYNSGEHVHAQFRIPSSYTFQFSTGAIRGSLLDSDSTFPLTLRVEEILKGFLIPSLLQHVSGERFSSQVDHVLLPFAIGQNQKKKVANSP